MDYKDVPLEGYIQHYMGVHTRFTVFDWHSTDRRDRSSLYMCTTRQTWKYTRFKMYAYTAIDGAFLIQIADVQEDNGKKAEGWCGVYYLDCATQQHVFIGSTYPNSVRLAATSR